ncbi:MAG: undecaprenyl/decaprenyl-phosphate alpha-N-acetylglucosaminyl 1-phosphate transferase [Tidjanibacter sp.]|nr:undecaprenyl/decaprenyl-phosphate alpha-N-acetylglucosaminyl 1-phosphate transferase [Tidjanibacter sp.]
MNVLLQILLPALTALLAVCWFQPHILRIAKDKNIVDNPDARKLQRIPIPVMGGIVVVFGILVGVMCFSFFDNLNSMLSVIAAVLVIMFVGLVDDIHGLSPKIRFLIEILIVLYLVYVTGNQINNFHGLWGIDILPAWASVPITVFACVGIINAINLIDGVDGYSSGYCIMASLYFGYAFFRLGNMKMVTLAAIMVAALIPFFCCNVFGKHSKMFIGDAGTLSMGILISTFVRNMLTMSTDATPIADNLGLIPLSLAIMCVPIFDTLRVMSARIARGTSPFYPDKTHLHHAFIDLGFSHIGTTVSILCMNTLVVLVWLIAYKCGASIDVQLYIVIAMSTLATFGLYAFIYYHIRRNTKIYRVMRVVARVTHIERKGIWSSIQNWLDRRSAPKEESDDEMAA